MKTLKKTMATLGTVAVVSIPVVAAISCGASKDADDVDITKSISFMKNGMFVDSNEYTPIKEESSITLEDFLKENRKIKKGEKIKVKDDRVVLADAYYSGKVQDISKIYKDTSSDAYQNMVKSQTLSEFKYINGSAILPRMKGGWGANRPVIEMGENDSLIYIFDDDDNDGRSLKEFKKQIMFEDTSVSMAPKITELNKIIGLKKGQWGYNRVPFIGNLNKGVLTSYFGSQNNHVDKTKKDDRTTETFEHMRTRLSAIFPKIVVDRIIEYYKTASRDFKPTEVPFGFIKYEVIGPNAIKVDFSKRPNVTAAHIGKISEDGKHHEWDAELSVGEASEWAAYNKKEASVKMVKSTQVGFENGKKVEKVVEQPNNAKYLIIGKH
ncbi:hypothetical protein [Mycoplasma todarodis]|uniref:TNase-like domain-containing protein n=1 Tax=Mycoplasma todarodis TaxID=1937191 RepID=A0A4R0XLC7_9MOLU|nr:hypothetical protein [Mycoplasma todarodis]TCG11453.1 hypothetical protein C4B25_01555 [Mycoplasma todarodis]